MRIPKCGFKLLALASVAVLAGCGGSGSGSGSTIGGGTGTTTVTPVVNTQPITVFSGPPGLGYVSQDQPYTSVTICVPGTTTCQTIANVLVDTGSSGLRLFASEVTIGLPQTTLSGSPVGNCVNFIDSSYMWGPLATADVKMAGEVASAVPIQLVNSATFPAAPLACSTGSTPANTISDLGATGILGVGNYRQDCGSACASATTAANFPFYFSCPAAGCAAAPIPVPVASQLQNPVWLFPQDNNGLLIQLPQVPDLGSASVAGSMIFGIGTQADNALGAATVITPNVNDGNFGVTFNGVGYAAGSGGGGFIDSGSTGMFFLDSATTGIAGCSTRSIASGLYCPPAELAETAIITGANAKSANVAFSVQNALTLLTTNSGLNTAFNDLSGPQPGNFDFGLAFFFGRNVFIGIEGQTTTGAGTGPFWAF